ncbi:hypothetical protein KDW_11450 [Dictyobacter vulcani]|uniref:DUF4352 domain-containing protein n=1 Tax=Dictyobacter vulcani TaxID=2607529 RepID=A0A5J4KH07_9CHLR|nr:DUF4352 domain-containing protein [Dictyobacter vulcani]GER86983.1 hypothetical protein KDW_11450 [Dictyobacter vulcani]
MQSNPNFPEQNDPNFPNQYNQAGQPQQPYPYNQPGQAPQPNQPPYNPQQPYPQGPAGPQQPYGQPFYPQMTPPPKKKSKVGLIVGIIVGVVLLCIVVGIIGAAMTASKTATTPTTITSSDKTNATPAPTDKPATDASGHNKVGTEVKVNDKWTAKVIDVKSSTGNDIIKPKSGNVYLIVHVSVKNTSAETQNVSSLLSFKLQDKDGQTYNETIYPDAGATPDGKVAPNSPLAGFIAYEVPAAQHNYTLQFTPDIVGNDQATWDLAI